MASLGKKLSFALLPAALLWLLAEGGVAAVFADELSSWRQPPAAEAGRTPTLSGNPYLLYEYRPGRHLQAGAPVTINSLGLRGEEPVLPKPAGTRRFLTTGDSSIFGFGVQDTEVFSAVAAATLGAPVEAINAATPGYSSYQTLNLLKLRALQTAPDLIVIGNLWSDNNFDAFVDKELLAEYRDYTTSTVGRLRGLLSHSAIFRVLDHRLRIAPAAQRVGFGDTERILDQGRHIGLRRVAIDDYAANLERLVTLAAEHDAEVLFLLPANNEDLRPILAEQQDKAWDPYRQVMRDTAARHGAPLIDVPDLFRASGRSREDLFLDEMHPTAVGHALMAEALVTLLRAQDWPSGGRVMATGSGAALPDYTDPFVETRSTTNTPSGAPSGTGRAIGGTVVCSGCASGTLQIEAIALGQAGGNPQVLGIERLQGPGAFRLEVRDATSVGLRAYVDLDGDGPDPDDQRFDLSASPIDVLDPDATRLRVDLDQLTVHFGD